MCESFLLKDFDFTVSDLEDFDKGRFRDVLKELKSRWISDYEKRNHTVRVGTAYISNRDGLGRVELVFRFPFDDKEKGWWEK